MSLEHEISDRSSAMSKGTLRDHVETHTELLNIISQNTGLLFWTMCFFGIIICGLLVWIGLRLHS